MENISVSVRVRPLSKVEQADGSAWRVEGSAITQCDPQTGEPERVRDAKYSLDNIFPPTASTRDIYDATTQHLMTKLVAGFNSTVFACGSLREVRCMACDAPACPPAHPQPCTPCAAGRRRSG